MFGNDSELKGIPFLFMSDPDPHAVEIYSMLMYASSQIPFTIMISICLRLEWAGATIKFYKKSLLNAAERSTALRS